MDASRFKLTGQFATSGDQTPVVAVAIGLNPFPACNAHVGIMYRDLSKRLWLVHLAWHNRLQNINSVGNFSAAILKLDAAEEPYIASYCGKVGTSHHNQRSIPYNLKYDPDTQFDAGGKLVLSSHGTGLSCATFVMTVFRSAGHPLIDAESWVICDPREAARDEAVQCGFVDQLAASGDPSQQAQAARITPEIGCPRYRPQDVAGAGLEDYPSVSFSVCRANGEYILSLLTSSQMPSP